MEFSCFNGCLTGINFVMIGCFCSFIKQYYEKLARNPQDLHKFYKDNSFFTYVDGVQVGLRKLPICSIVVIRLWISFSGF